MKLILIRHGETEWNRQRRVQGLMDNDLNPTGIQQAEALERALASERLDAIYTSPLLRAIHTGKVIARTHHMEPVIIPGLRELDVGNVDGLTYDEMKKHYGNFLSDWIRDCSTARLPGGHTLLELQKQTWGAVREILRMQGSGATGKNGNPGGVVIAVTHYFPILSILSKALRIDLAKCRRIRIDLASITILNLSASRPQLVSLNETCHLKEIPDETATVSFKEGSTVPRRA